MVISVKVNRGDGNMKQIKVFTMSNCGVSRQVIKRLTVESVPFTKIDIEKNAKLAYAYDIMASPTIILEEDGEIKSTLIGYRKEDGLDKRIKEFI